MKYKQMYREMKIKAAKFQIMSDEYKKRLEFALYLLKKYDNKVKADGDLPKISNKWQFNNFK